MSAPDRLTPLTTAADATGADAAAAPSPAARLRALLDAAPARRAAIVGSGRTVAVTSLDLVTFPVATATHLGSLGPLTPPLVWVTARMLLVQWTHPDGTPRTLLWNPIDHEHPRLRAGLGLTAVAALPAATVRHGRVPGHLRALGVDAADVDYVAFDHLQQRDLRRLLGTTGPAPDLGVHDEPVTGWLPRARLLVHRTEWEAACNPHPARADHYLATALAALPQQRIEAFDCDVLVGPGVALLALPGLTAGQVSLAVNTDQGLWIVSANGIAVDCWDPAASRVPALARHARDARDRVVLPAARAELATWQHDAMLLERAIADRNARAPFPQILPAAEVADHPFNWRLRAAYRYGAVTHGQPRGGRVVPATEEAS